MIVWIAFLILVVTGIIGIIVVLINSSSNQTVKSKEQQAHGEAVRIFSENAYVFTGLYEAMYSIRTGSLRDGTSVFEDWNTRMETLENADELLSFWNVLYANHENWDRNEAAKKAYELLAFASEAGVNRSTETELTVDQDTFRFYDILNGTGVATGLAATVETPYWSQRNTVLEKGEIRVDAETAESEEEFE